MIAENKQDGRARAAAVQERDAAFKGRPHMANIVGTNGNDNLVGTNDSDTISGLGGNDRLVGLLGRDALDGGPGSDTAVYRYETFVSGGVSADILGGGAQVIEQGSDIDSFTSIENLEGTENNDLLRGDNNANHIHGLGGNDLIEGRGGDDRLEGGSGRDLFLSDAGNDRLDGGIGSDRVDHLFSPAGIGANLATGTVRDGFGTTDTLVSIEDAQGSAFDDRLTGSPGANRLNGLLGDDRIDAGAGDDRLEGHDGNDILNGGGGDDFIAGDEPFDETFVGSDTIRGESGNDLIKPGPGNDFVDGGGGSDTVSYEQVFIFREPPLEEIFVDLQTRVGRDEFGQVDTLVSVENLIGFVEGDTLLGNDRANELRGLQGNDTINGRTGADTLEGGEGDDTVDGGVDTARDVFVYAFDAETPSDNDGSDIIRNLDVEEDALRVESGLITPLFFDNLLTVEDDGTDTTLRFFEGGASITLLGVTSPDTPFDSMTDLVNNDIVILV